MSVARHHNEWLSLVEVSGPFLSLPVLLRVFPQGLDSRDPSQASRLRDAYEDWLERGTKTPAVHRAWIRLVLDDVLAYPANLLAEGQAIPPGLDTVMATFSETLRPDMVLKHRETDQKPILLISVYPPNQDLQKPVSGKLWKASPGTRMMELLHGADVPIGLVTNGEEWMLVSARRNETTGFASWYADLWMQEPLTLRAFHSLLHLRRLIGVPAPETLSGLLIESSKDQQEVTDQLGYQVRDAVEVLVQAFDRVDAESGRTLLAQVDEKTLYDGALTVMMRLVFLFSAEERGLLLLGDPLYDQNYAVSTLRELLRERADQHGEEVLERRHDAWCRLLATFRAVHAGVEHEAMRLPPYGGTLFDPDRYPFLEGRSLDDSWHSTTATPLVINNRVVLHLLEALQMLRVKVPGGGPAETRRLSFSALDIEQIGHVYEGLLDHTAKRAHEVFLGLAGSKGKEPEVPLRTLEELAPKGKAALVEYLRDQTGRSEAALTHLVDDPTTIDDYVVLTACGQDEVLLRRIKPFASLLRRDSFGHLAIIQTGSIYVTAGTDRRRTGTHYTPRLLTEPIVRYTLEPLVYIGPAIGLPPAEWTLKGSKEILALKVCDMAMGSGAFLVEVCRYLAIRLVEAWENAEREHPGSFVVTPDGGLSSGSPAERLIPADSAERVAIARRYVADRCLYGVDINPMAVEMAKLSLWLITLQRDRPFGFLDHALKCGDSLFGVTSLHQIENFSLRPGERQEMFAGADLSRNVEEASAKRRDLEDMHSNDHTQIEAKNRLHGEAEAATAKIKALADTLIAFELDGLEGESYERRRADEAAKVHLLIKRDADPSLNPPISNQQSFLAAAASDALSGRRTFHWPVEFPEVFVRGGFDAFVGNPPFMGGTRLEPALGTDYREFLVQRIANNVRGLRGAADLCSYFFLRANRLLNTNGCCGLIGTNSLAQGDSAIVGLEQIVLGGSEIYRAVSSTPWPGVAALEVAHVWLSKCHTGMTPLLDGCEVAAISPRLSGESAGTAFVLATSVDQAFEGVKPAGLGFVLTIDEAQQLLGANPANGEVLRPYLNGEDVNTDPQHRPSRWIINFRDFPLERDNSTPRSDVGSTPSAADFPDCLAIVEKRVRPERLALSDSTAWNRGLRARWWQFGLWRPALAAALGTGKHALVSSRVTANHNFAVVPTSSVFSDRLVVIARADWSSFAVISSTIHGEWAHRPGATTHETRLTYLPTWAYATFAFPASLHGLKAVGEHYHEHRRQLMLARLEGLTRTYNRFHSSGETSEDIARLRALHVEMDQAVAVAYGWNDLDLLHGFHETKRGVQFTIGESARRVVLARLLALNHQEHEEEGRASLHIKRKKKSGGRTVRRSPSSQGSLLGH